MSLFRIMPVLGVALLTGFAGVALAQDTVAGEAEAGASTQASGPTTAEADVVTSLADKFAELDTDRNGLLSAAEAEADPTVGAAYESFDTTNTIEDSASNARAGGITLEQFEAGMQAAARSGAIGPPVSGGETYLVYPDGTMERVKGTGADAKGKLQPNPSRK